MSRTVIAKVPAGTDGGVHAEEEVVLGSLAEQDSDAVSITGGSISGIESAKPNASALSGAGTGQSDATAVAYGLSRFGTVGSGTGAVLPTAVAGKTCVIFNRGSNALLVYPATGGAINALSANAGYSLAAGKSAIFAAFSATQWDTVLSA